MNMNEDSPISPVVEESRQEPSQEEADRFNRDMEVRRLPYRARIVRDPTPHFVVEPPLPAELFGANYEAIYAGRTKRRAMLVDCRDQTTDPPTIRRIDMMIDNHDRGTDRIRSHEPGRERPKRAPR